jgi:hypothetical protein
MGVRLRLGVALEEAVANAIEAPAKMLAIVIV